MSGIWIGIRIRAWEKPFTKHSRFYIKVFEGPTLAAIAGRVIFFPTKPCTQPRDTTIVRFFQ